jgi:hypothetical protein
MRRNVKNEKSWNAHKKKKKNVIKSSLNTALPERFFPPHVPSTQNLIAYRLVSHYSTV